ncbi:MAG: hypothetical protein ACP5RI_00095 [Candidatus Micrarchaeia archaeon]
MFEFLKPKNIIVNGINIKLNGFIHSIKKQNKFSNNNILIKIPFKNNLDGNTQKEININKISVDPPFTISNISPSLPVDVKPNTSIIFQIRLKGPDYKYEGPVSFEFN